MNPAWKYSASTELIIVTTLILLGIVQGKKPTGSFLPQAIIYNI